MAKASSCLSTAATCLRRWHELSRWLALAWITLVPAQLSAAAEPSSDKCPSSVVALITRARDAATRGSLQSASSRYGDLLSRVEEMSACSPDFRLSARREYGDVLAGRAARAERSAERRRFGLLAAEQYGAYLDEVVGGLSERGSGLGSVVLNAFANVTFEADDCDSLADRLEAVSSAKPTLFQKSAIDKWRKCFDKAAWESGAREARLQEYCGLVTRSDLRITGGSRAALAAVCRQ